MFSGTPCQVDALIKYLEYRKVNHENLYTVDVLCHGTPENKWWDEYKKWFEEKNHSKLDFFSFRWKYARWHGYSVCAKLKNGKIKVNTHDLQVYMDLYFTHQIMRKCCYQCKFATNKRCSDITLGDFWGAKQIFKDRINYKQIEDGVSLIICNTNKGRKVINLLVEQNNKTAMIIKCDSDKYIDYQSALVKPVEKPSNNELFEKEYKEKGFEYILNKYARYNKKGHVRFFIKWIANQLGLIH